MSLLDWVVVVVYFVWIVVDGLRRRRAPTRSRATSSRNRSLPWWAVGLSVMATQMSAVTLVGTTGQAYATGLRFIQFYFGLPLAMIILSVTVVPFFHARQGLHRLRVSRAALRRAHAVAGELPVPDGPRVLARRHAGRAGGRHVGDSRLAAAGHGARDLRADDSLHELRRRAGGGLDRRQADVRHRRRDAARRSSFCCTGIPRDVGFGQALHLAGATGRLQAIDFRFDLRETYTFWSGMIGGLFLMLSYFGCDQSQVQRYLTAKSVDEARQSLLMSAFVKIPLQLLILGTGVLVFVFYLFQTPPMLFNRTLRRAGRGEPARPREYAALEREFDAAIAVAARGGRARRSRGVSRERRAGARHPRARRRRSSRRRPATSGTTTSTTCFRRSSRRGCRSAWSG